MKARPLAISAAAFAISIAIYSLTVDAQPDPPLLAEALARKVGCMQCHAVDEVVAGPSYHDIAARYAGTPGARAILIERVKKGSKGYWSDISKGVPMPPYRGRLSDAEITRLVEWVMAQ